MTTIVQSKRLDLVPLTPDLLRLLLDGKVSIAAETLGVAEPGLAEIPRDIMELHSRHLEANPELQPWMIRAIVLREQGICVGNIGFHTAPGAEYLAELSPNGVEMGYQVSEPWRRRGIVTEAIEALMCWASEFHQVRSFVVSISPSNVPSLRLASKLGFQKIGSHIDEIDGPEDIFERSYPLAEPTRQHSSPE